MLHIGDARGQHLLLRDIRRMQEHQPLLDGGKAIGDLLRLPPQIAGLVLGDGVGGELEANVEEVCLHLAPIGVLCYMHARSK